jgi:hypothetical protein
MAVGSSLFAIATIPTMRTYGLQALELIDDVIGG